MKSFYNSRERRWAIFKIGFLDERRTKSVIFIGKGVKNWDQGGQDPGSRYTPRITHHSGEEVKLKINTGLSPESRILGQWVSNLLIELLGP